MTCEWPRQGRNVRCGQPATQLDDCRFYCPKHRAAVLELREWLAKHYRPYWLR